MISRRDFLSAGSTLALGGLLAPAARARTANASIVIVGGGFGGATAARFLKRLMPDARITLVEPNQQYVACPFSNLVLTGLRSIVEQQFSYGAIAGEGVVVAVDTAKTIDPVSRIVNLGAGKSIYYDRLILSPGIDFRWDGLPGYDSGASDSMPHAWKAGAQTQLLARQLAAMPDGGVVAMSVTAAPFRCPPGPYERASLIAHYLKQNKPRSKLLVLDSNSTFSKQSLFMNAWKNLYGDLIEWRGPSNDGRVREVDPAAMTLSTDFEVVSADVVNIVPPQRAGVIAERAGTTDQTGWCPINAVTFESTLQDNIHVIGDATIAAPMPKSAFSANAQAKVCAIQIARLLNDMAPEPTTLANTCYSFLTDQQAISVSGVYSSRTGEFTNVPGAGGISPMVAQGDLPAREAAHARDWFSAITREVFL